MMAKRSGRQNAPRVPLSNLTYYLGIPGGLYGNGSNTVPTAHATAVNAAIANIVRRAAGGTPNGSGLIGIMSIGPSNASHAWEAYSDQFDANWSTWGADGNIRNVNTATAGYASQQWADGSNDIWNVVVPAAVAAAGLTRHQIGVAWLELPRNYEPGRTYDLKDPNAEPWEMARDTADTLRELKLYAPNCWLALVSERTYGGWNPPNERVGLNEAYMHSFGVRDLTLAQIDIGLTYHGATYGDLEIGVDVPAILWGSLQYGGPDVWPKVYYQGDPSCNNDGNYAHLCGLEPNNGRRVAGTIIADLLRNDPFCTPWFLL